jgi:p-cumate 2,3-dioxygenase subunit alpha
MAAIIQTPLSYRSRYLWLDRERGRFLVHRSAYTSPEIFEEERRRILHRSWIVLGHESEVPNKGDFVVRQVVDRELIFNRDVDGKVNAFFNSCRHRGAAICREPRGNRTRFVCPYHGWAYKSSGELFNQHSSFGYGERFNEGGFYDLTRVARIDKRAGFYFVNFDPGAISLDDYLQDAGPMLDAIAEQSAVGMEVVRGCHEYEIKANYKLICENSYDGYHLDITHASFVDYMRTMVRGVPVSEMNIRGIAKSLGNGHACFELEIPTGRPVAQWLPVWGEEARLEIDAKKKELESRLGKAKADRISVTNRNMVIFPNSIINDQQTVLLRTVTPMAHNRMIIRAWSIGPKDEGPVLRRIRNEGALSFLGPGGFATPDDVEMLELCQRGFENADVEWNDISKGFRPEENTLRDYDEHYDNELQMRAYWYRWNEIMSAPEPRG